MTVPLDASAAVDDARLLAAFARGDRSAARTLADRHLPRAYRHALRVLGDRTEAEDVAQEAMLRLWQQAAHWQQGEAQVSTWVYRVTANLCTDRLRRRRTRGTVDLEAAGDPPDGAPGAEARLHAAARTEALQSALATLPDRQRQAVVLRHIEGLGNPEIAEILGIGVEAVESLTARGKRALAAVLAGRREELGHEP
ncbi:MAG: RNA polymerase sigma factor [Rhodobacteraceae bacterium]|jgi:RNA polymerase sigma-70 factor (ECF subfamily)|nr:RNA polymerase sigma factor [Paracoccaceae bacterium]